MNIFYIHVEMELDMSLINLFYILHEITVYHISISFKSFYCILLINITIYQLINAQLDFFH